MADDDDDLPKKIRSTADQRAERAALLSREGQQARSEYDAESRAIDDRTTRLRALRLEQERLDKLKAAAEPPPKKAAPRRKKTVA